MFSRHKEKVVVDRESKEMCRYCWSVVYEGTFLELHVFMLHWKLFYSGADQTMSAQACVGIITSPQLSNSMFNRISL